MAGGISRARTVRMDCVRVARDDTRTQQGEKIMMQWAKIPTRRIGGDQNILQDLVWKSSENGTVIAALMLYIVLVQHANEEPTYERPELGWTSLTYDDMSRIASLSRAMVASGIKLLEERGLIMRVRQGRRVYCRIMEYDKEPWAKLPGRSMYDTKLRQIPAFKAFTLRNKFELHALKLFLLIVARRDRKTNLTHLTYEQLSPLAGVNGNDIKRALSFLGFPLRLIIIERIVSHNNNGQIAQAYRLEGVEPRKHLGTTNVGLENDVPAHSPPPKSADIF